MCQVRLTDTVAKVALAKKNALSVRTSNSVNQGFFWGGGGGEKALGKTIKKPKQKTKP